MKTSRRKFISTSVAGGLAAAIPLSGCSTSAAGSVSVSPAPDYSKLDQILKMPVFKRELFSVADSYRIDSRCQEPINSD